MGIEKINAFGEPIEERTDPAIVSPEYNLIAAEQQAHAHEQNSEKNNEDAARDKKTAKSMALNAAGAATIGVGLGVAGGGIPGLVVAGIGLNAARNLLKHRDELLEAASLAEQQSKDSEQQAGELYADIRNSIDIEAARKIAEAEGATIVRPEDVAGQ